MRAVATDGLCEQRIERKIATRDHSPDATMLCARIQQRGRTRHSNCSLQVEEESGSEQRGESGFERRRRATFFDSRSERSSRKKRDVNASERLSPVLVPEKTLQSTL